MISTDAMLTVLRDVAEEVIRPKFRALTSDEVIQKGPGDLVTVADRLAEERIVAKLEKLAPNALLVGEEGTFAGDMDPAALASAEVAYTIDPIDGTSNFVRGNPDYGVMVAEVRDGVTTRAWIWQPEHGVAWTAELGGGTHRNNQRVEPVERSGKPRGSASAKKHRGMDGGGRLDPVRSTLWSAAFDYPNVVTGGGDFVYYNKLKPWDHLPGALLLTEVGGVSRTRDGADYTAATTGQGLIAAATPEIWDLANEVWPA